MKLSLLTPTSRGKNRDNRTRARRTPRAQRVGTFLIFLAISTALWLSRALQAYYTTEIPIPIEYVGWNAKVAAEGELPTHLDAHVNARGVSLLGYSLFGGKPQPLEFTLRESDLAEGVYRVSAEAMKQAAQDRLPHTIRVNGTHPSDIAIPIEKRQEKRVPIVSGVTIEAQPGYFLHPVRLEPSEVTIYGSRQALDLVKAVHTDSLHISYATEDFCERVTLLTPPNVYLAQDTATLHVHIAELVDKKCEQLPIQALNAPPGYTLRLLPGRADVILTVETQNFAELNTEGLKLYVDYLQLTHEAGATNHLPIQLLGVPEQVVRYRIAPARISFILQKNDSPALPK